MRLSHFIAETLTEIVNGVRSAQDNVKETNAEISPSGLHKFSNDQFPGPFKPGRGIVNMVEYDVGVETEGEGSAKAGVGVFLATIGIGTQVEGKERTSAVHRIRFSVPLLLPSKNALEDQCHDAPSH
ncbi:MAG: hypothetical protein JSU63_18330 [Phycisphaerales bacterium]|nr:MAG: hypothetical protein JSU63_18330 [Phycisphaerales bacterium]